MRVYTRMTGAQGQPGKFRALWVLIPAILLGSCRDGSGLPEGESLDFVALSTGNGHTCGMSANGFGYCWGDNSVDQLGSSTGSLAVSPEVILLRPLRLRSLVAGGDLTCGAITSGAVYCWGEGSQAPLRIHGSEGMHDLAVGAFACMLDDAGGASCWPGDSKEPQAIGGGLTFTVLRVGDQACGITSGHEVYCWAGPADPPVQLGGGILFDSLTVGNGHACGLTNNGNAYCWGNGSAGQLGNFSFGSFSTPQPVSTAINFITITAGGSHTCALTAAGDTYCWGSNTSGQLGFGGPPTSGLSIPGKVFTSLQFTSIEGGGAHTCAALADRTAYCWGENGFGAVGDGTTVTKTEPTLVADQ